MMAAAMAFVIFIIARIRNDPTSGWFSGGALWQAFKDAVAIKIYG